MSGLAVVTGGTGFIGWNLCERLIAEGWDVRGVVRPSSSNELPEGVERFDAPLEAAAMAPALDGADVVYHLAGITRALDYATFERVNAGGAEAAARAARRADARFVLVSSMAAGGSGTRDRPRRESDATEPTSDYGASKLAGEARVASVEGLRYTIARPPGVYGPRDQDFLALFRFAKRGWFPLLGSPDTAYTLVHVDDTARILMQMAAAIDDGGTQGRTFYLGHERAIAQSELGTAMGDAVGRRVRLIPVPRAVLRTVAELGEWSAALSGRPALVNRSRYRELTAPGFVCDVSALRDEIGCEACIDLEEGLASTVEWYRQQGWL